MLNATKYKVLHIGKKNPEHNYRMKLKDEIVEISECNEEKDLGIIFDKALSFDCHIQNAISKANRMVRLIKRPFRYITDK